MFLCWKLLQTYGRPNGYRKVLKDGKCLYLGVDDCRQDVGTTVIVRDVFYDQPVRRKQMHPNPENVLHSLKESLLLYILYFKLLILKVRITCVAHMLLLLHCHYCPVSLGFI